MESTLETPIAPHGPASVPAPGRVCRRCGAGAVADEQSCRSCGSFLASNSMQLRHGKRRRLPAIDPEASPLFVAYAKDLGGLDELTAGQRAALRRLVEADHVATTAFHWLSTTRQGPASEQVSRVVGAMLSAATSTFRALSLLGLERRQRPLPTLSEYLASRQREAEQGEGVEP